MKKSTRTALAFVLTLVMIVTGTTMAFAAVENGGSQSVTVKSTVTNPIFVVTVPTAMTFAVDPYEVAGKGQIVVANPGYTILNKSNVPVQVYTELTPTVKNEAALTGAAFISTSTAVTAKNINLNADVLKVESVDLKGVVTATTAGITSAALESTTTPVAFCFKLDKAEYKAPTTPTGNPILDATKPVPVTGAAVISLSGKVNPGAKWIADDVNVTTVYKFRALTADEDAARTYTDADLKLINPTWKDN